MVMVLVVRDSWRQPAFPSQPAWPFYNYGWLRLNGFWLALPAVPKLQPATAGCSHYRPPAKRGDTFWQLDIL